MNLLHNLFFTLSASILIVISEAAVEDLVKMLNSCPIKSENFDNCMKDTMNDLRVFFKTGIPEFKVRPFDPHRASYIEQRRGDIQGLGGYRLILRNVSEYGWTQSEVTKFKRDIKNNQIIYSQYFPEKYLEGYYELSAMIMGNPMKRHGHWNLTLYRYDQTTTVKRTGEPGSQLKVNIVIGKIGDMDLHIENFFGSERYALNSIADTLINSMWELGFPFIKPLIDDLVSTAFTAIFNESFRYFPFERFIR